MDESSQKPLWANYSLIPSQNLEASTRLSSQLPLPRAEGAQVVAYRFFQVIS